MKVVSTENSQILAAKCAKNLGIGMVHTACSRFPDGELYIRRGELDDRTVIFGSIIDSDSFMELLLLIDACEETENLLVLPYMGYARQDKKFHEGEAVSARAVARALSAGISGVLSVNIHEESVLSHFGVPAVNISLAPDIGAHIGTWGLSDPLILSPDSGAAAFAAEVAAVGGWETDHLVKTRLSGDKVRIEPKNIDVSGHDAIIVDDIISTGGTLATAASMLTAQGACSVSAFCVHGVFASGGYSRLAAAGLQRIAASDTIGSAASTISAAGRIAAAVRHKNDG